MSKIIYVMVKHGKPVQIARPLQGSTQVATEKEKTSPRWRSWRQVIAWDGWKDHSDGVYSLIPSWKGGYGQVSAAPKKVNVASKIKQIDKKWGEGYEQAETGSPGIKGFQHRAEASSVAQKNRAREAKELLAWLKGLHEEDDSARSSLFERLTGQR